MESRIGKVKISSKFQSKTKPISLYRREGGHRNSQASAVYSGSSLKERVVDATSFFLLSQSKSTEKFSDVYLELIKGSEGI